MCCLAQHMSRQKNKRASGERQFYIKYEKIKLCFVILTIDFQYIVATCLNVVEIVCEFRWKFNIISIGK